MSGSRSYLILALNDRDRTIADWRARQGTDWVDQMLLGGMLKCAEHGYRMIFELVDTHDDHVERELRVAIAALQPDGVILTPPHSDNPRIVDLLDEAGDPLRADRLARRGGRDRADDGRRRRGAAWRPLHLAGLGHRRIGFIAGSPEYALSGWRVDGWQSRDGRGGPRRRRAARARATSAIASGDAAARALLDCADPPTAIIASNDQMALAALDVAAERGIDVPGRAVAGQLRQYARRALHPAAADRGRPADRRDRRARGGD